MLQTAKNVPVPPPDEILMGENFEGWSDTLRDELLHGMANTQVGQKLLSASERVKVWSIVLQPGERIGFHRHDSDYFWTALCEGRSIQHSHDGRTRRVVYSQGQTRHVAFAPGEYLVHDLHNVGDAPLSFITVEFVEKASVEPASRPSAPNTRMEVCS